MKLALIQDGQEIEVAEGDYDITRMIRRLNQRLFLRGTVLRSGVKSRYGERKAKIAALMQEKGIDYWPAYHLVYGKAAAARRKAARAKRKEAA